MTGNPEPSVTKPSESRNTDIHRLRLQLLGQLGVTRYQLQSPDLLSAEMAQWADEGSFELSSLELSSLERSSPDQKTAISTKPVSPQSTQTEKAPGKAEKPRQPRDLADLRALISTGNPTADPANTSQAKMSQPEQQNTSTSLAEETRSATVKASHREAPAPVLSHTALVNATDKLLVNTSVYSALPDWLWQDVLMLLEMDPQQVIAIAPQQRLSHTQQARLICLNTPQTAFYANNIVGIDSVMLAELSTDIASEQYWQAKQQLWRLLRTVIAE